MPKFYTNFDHNFPYARYFIQRIMEVADVEMWSDLKGKAIRVKVDNNKICALGHIIKMNWFYLSVDFESIA